jgi:hypothetical protein
MAHTGLTEYKLQTGVNFMALVFHAVVRGFLVYSALSF